jgi:type III secretion protein S
MNYEDLIQIATQGLVLVLVISLPVTLISALVGLGVSFFQAITSLQDSTVSQGLKLLVVTAVLFFAAPWAGSLIVQYGMQVMAAATK